MRVHVCIEAILVMTQIELCYVEQKKVDCAFIFHYRKLELM